MNLRKVITLWGAVGALLASLTIPSLAGVGFGGSIQGTFFETTGTEKLKSNNDTETAKEDALGWVPSGYLQYQFGNGLVVGYEMTPGAVEIGAKSRTDSDLQSGITSTGVTQTAKAEVSDLSTWYVETPGFGPGGFFLSAGWTTLTVDTLESLGTGAAYGSDDIDAGTFGVGFKRTLDNGMNFKFAATYTDFEEVTLKSTGSDAVTTITAEPEAFGAKITVGYQF